MRQNAVFSIKNTNSNSPSPDLPVGRGHPIPTPDPLDPLHAEILGTPLALLVGSSRWLQFRRLVLRPCDVFRSDAPLNHSLGVVMAKLTASSSNNSAIRYSVLPGSVQAMDKFNQPVTSTSGNFDYTVRYVDRYRRKYK